MKVENDLAMPQKNNLAMPSPVALAEFLDRMNGKSCNRMQGDSSLRV